MIFFVDFDGTITKTDTCAAMVETFAREGWEEINKAWENKEISTQECANRTFELFNADLNDIRKLLYRIEIDEFFNDFIDLCRHRDDPVYILSDGYDLNIQTILTRYGLDMPYYSNQIRYDGRFHIQCPHLNESCGKCGTCKTGLIQELSKDQHPIIYIGDGYSDTCAATHADLVFAKGTLYNFCLQNGLNVRQFDNFKDIISEISK